MARTSDVVERALSFGKCCKAGWNMRNGRPCATTLQILKEKTVECTPEVVAQKTGLSVEAVKKIEKDYAETENVYIVAGYGMRYRNLNETYRALMLLGCITGRQRFFMQSSFTDDPITIKLSGETPATRLNPADAEELGLKQGDKVEVYNDRGHVVTRLDLDESIVEEVADPRVNIVYATRR